MTKTILYLDQNIVSNLAKVGNVPDWKDSLKDFYSSLIQLLKTKVNQNRLACPTSNFHRQESEQNARFKDHVWHFMERLSHSLSFNSFVQIANSQLASAAYAYAGKDVVFVPDWTIAFNQDPHEPADSNTDAAEIMIHLESAQKLIDYSREVTNLIADVYGKLKLTRKGQSSTFQEEVLYLKMLLLFETFLPPSQLVQDYPELDSEISGIGAIEMIQNQTKLLAILEYCGARSSTFVPPETWYHDGSTWDSESLRNYVNGVFGITNKFLNSQELLTCPFLHIRASLMAVDIINYPDMVPSPSLSTDFEIVASILPYVDILATDNHMADLIRQAGLSSKFPAQVFSMNRRNELLNEIELL